MLKRNTGRRSPLVVLAFFVSFLLVFFGVVVTATIVTFILPEAYSSTARIKLNLNPNPVSNTNGQSNEAPATGVDLITIQTESAVIQSEIILDPVIEKLGLNEVWQKKYNSETKFRTADTRAALKHMLEVRPAKNTSLINITVYSDDRVEAATIANAIAEEYQRHLGPSGEEFSGSPPTGRLSAFVIEHAEPSTRPVRPNKPLNIALGVIIGAGMGTLIGGIVAFVVGRLIRHQPPTIPELRQT